MNPAVKQLLGTSAAQKLVLLQAWCLVPVALLALRAVPFDQLLQRVGRLPTQAAPSPGTDLAALRDTGRLVNAAVARSPWTCTCLPRSLILHYLLRRRQIASELRIGISRVDHEFRAHAWVEYLGVPLNDREDIAQWFSPFDALPARIDVTAFLL